MSRKLPFLPVFFVTLGVVFAIAVFIRIRAYQVNEAVAAQQEQWSGGVQPADSRRDEARRSTPEEGTIEPVETVIEPGSEVATTTAANRANARQQRYNELLRGTPADTNRSVNAAPAVAAPAAPKQEPGLIKRMGNAIASALGGGRTDPPAAPVQPPPRPRVEQPRESPRDRPTEPQEPPDPNSDTTPPQLLTVEFNPPQIRDGETTSLIVTVTDDLSGVATVSGVIASPSNALQGFACQREPETNRYIARITVPAEAAEGVWKINYLTLSDNARNSVNLSAAQGMLPPTSTFRVTSSAPDSTGPVLKSVWVDKPSMRAGERNTIFVQAEDDKAGVSSVNGVLLSPAKAARIGFNCRTGGSGAWECTVTPPQCLDCGVWTVEQIQLEDKARNMTSFRADNPIVQRVTIDITGESCDAHAPAMAGLTLEPVAVSNAEASTIIARAMVQDDGCGVLSVSGQAVGPGGPNAPRLYFSFERQGEMWQARIAVPKHAAKGTWTVSWIQVLDRGNNLKAYSERDPGLAGVAFRVQ